MYDIFWVFGTDVMVTVAKSFDAPVKLLWPKDVFAEQLHFSMLGLGDIVIPGALLSLGPPVFSSFLFIYGWPDLALFCCCVVVLSGIFIALMLRFDVVRARKQKLKKNFPKPYFNFTYIGYFLGMVTTIGVMHVFKAAQVP